MAVLGIDLSMRSTGLCYIGKTTEFALIQYKEDAEELLCNIADYIEQVIKSFPDITTINLEGLSFGSLSGSKDIIAGNFWNLRCHLRRCFPEIKVVIVPVLSWRSPLFSKEERKQMKDYDAEVKALKKKLKTIKDKKEKAELTKNNEKAIFGASIKHQTFLKCPAKVQKQILAITCKDSMYDLADSFFIASYVEKKK